MDNLTKNKTHKRILFSIIIVAGLIIASSSFSMVRGGNFLLASVLNNISDDIEPISDEGAVIVQTKKIFLEDITQSISASAMTEPLNQAKVSSKMAGKVVGIYFKEGDWVNTGQTIIQLEQDQTLRVTYNNAQTNLINTRASMSQDIKTAEVAVEAAKVTLTNAGKSLNNTGASNEQMIDSAYTTALNTSRNAVLIGVNALVTLTNIQYQYMNSSSQQDMSIAEKKAGAIYALLGRSNAGRYTSQFIGQLNGGVREQVEEAINNPTHEKIDQILIDIVPAVQKVRDVLSELRPNMEWKQTTSAEKTAIDLTRADIEASLTALSNVQQAITNAKLGETTGNDAVQSAYDGAEKQLESVEANLISIKKRAELQIVAAQGQLDFAQAQLDNTVITAPISGIVSQKYIEIGEAAIPGNPVAEIVNTSNIEIKLSLTEFDIGKIFIGQEAEVSLAAYPDEKFIGKVHYVSSVADRVSKKFPVKIQLKNIDGKVKAGMVADVKIITNQQKDVLVVPKPAVFEEDGIEKVYVVENLKVKTKTIKTEVVTEDKLKIVEGLSIGEEIIINGNYDLRDGDLVTVENQ